MSASNTEFNWPDWVLAQTGSSQILGVESVQTLWGGCGELLRIHLSGGSRNSVILKKISQPSTLEPNASDLRKRRSYEVESNWYSKLASRCDDDCRVAQFLGLQHLGHDRLLLLEDLREAGYHPVTLPSHAQTASGLSWLAHFHAKFMGERVEGLWEQGSYWHLDTRQEEWNKMSSGILKNKAQEFDQRLKKTRFQTVIHGDAKYPNFCWSADNQAAAVDFQYIGHGCGMRDVALFLSRCVTEENRAEEMDSWLGLYFQQLRSAMGHYREDTNSQALVEEWSPLFCVAWSDYLRFREGWADTKHLSAFDQLQLGRASKALDSASRRSFQSSISRAVSPTISQ